MTKVRISKKEWYWLGAMRPTNTPAAYRADTMMRCAWRWSKVLRWLREMRRARRSRRSLRTSATRKEGSGTRTSGGAQIAITDSKNPNRGI